LDKYLEKKRCDNRAKVAARTCVICGKPIDPKTRRQRYCSEACAEIGDRKNILRYREVLKEQRKSLKSERKTKPKKSNLDKTIKEMVKYNKKHGKNLSYGEYSRLVGL
jgi:predicted nucleic acid-binding Zn ribbon protein